jgi:short-subunit dehydrogenase
MAWSGKTAIVTGASSGIGLSTALRLAQEGLHVAIVARRIDRLQALAREINQNTSGSAMCIQADLSVEANRLRVVDTVHSHWSDIDILINNAGFGWYGYVWNMPWTVAASMLRVNIEAVTHLTMLVLPEMKKRDHGAIINIGSIIGDMHVQGSTLYASSKSYLDAFTTALFRELRGSNVQISIVKAGPVATEFFDVSEKTPNGLRLPAEKFAISPTRVADRIWRLLNRPRLKTYIPGWTSILPGVETFFAWVLNRAGPILLQP